MTYSAIFSAALMFLMGGQLAGQAFRDLATSDDGSSLYFSSPVRERGKTGTFYYKIYQWTAERGVQVFAEVTDPGDFDGCNHANFYHLRAPQVSRDGFVFAMTASRPVMINRACPAAEADQGVVMRASRIMNLPGALALSPNGHYAVTVPYAAAESQFHVVTDLQTGVAEEVVGKYVNAPQTVTDDGTVVRTEKKAIVLTSRTGQTRMFRTSNSDPLTAAVIDPDARFIYYTKSLGPGTSESTITQIEIRSGIHTKISGGLETRLPFIPRDSGTVYFIAVLEGGQQLHFWDGQARHRITNEAGRITGAVISGDGRVAFAVNADARIVRIDLTSGAITEIVPATPFVSGVGRIPSGSSPVLATSPVVPIGGRIQLSGFNLGQVSRATMCGRTLPVSPDPIRRELQLFVPDDLPAGMCDLVVTGTSPYEHGVGIELKERLPEFVSSLWRGDFLHPVSDADPALPGEIVIAYMTGLGRAVPQGLSEPGFGCVVRTSNGSSTAEVQFVGPAPGFQGIFQVHVKIPTVRQGRGTLSCGWFTAGGETTDTQIWIGSQRSS